MRFKSTLILTGAALAAAGCAPVDPGFGEAVRYDMAVQTIDPDPQYPADALQPGYHGEKGQKATERYRKGTVKPVTQGTGGGNAGGAGGGNTPGS
ncbi:MAG: hypothetical protein M3Q19_11875 [Pseudomonadota bacterium]|nr:hypothetical protein [Pseudomonadota bacterium]